MTMLSMGCGGGVVMNWLGYRAISHHGVAGEEFFRWFRSTPRGPTPMCSELTARRSAQRCRRAARTWYNHREVASVRESTGTRRVQDRRQCGVRALVCDGGASVRRAICHCQFEFAGTLQLARRSRIYVDVIDHSSRFLPRREGVRTCQHATTGSETRLRSPLNRISTSPSEWSSCN